MSDIRLLGASEAPADCPKVEDLGVERWSLSLYQDERGMVERTVSVVVREWTPAQLDLRVAFQGAVYRVVGVQVQRERWGIVYDLSLQGVE